MDNQIFLCRSFSKGRPTCLEIPDDPSIRVEDFVLLFRSRDKDRDSVSFWEINSKATEDRFIAGWAARNDSGSRDKVGILKIPKSIFDKLDIHIKIEPDYNIFSCLTHLHRSVDLSSEEAVIKLAEKLRSYLKNEAGSLNKIYRRVKKSEIQGHILSVIEECEKQNSTIESHKMVDWAQKLYLAR